MPSRVRLTTKSMFLFAASFIVSGVSLAEAKGILQIKSQDASISWEVKIDGKPQSFRSGMEIRLDEGSHRITASAPGYQPIDESFSIKDGVVKIVTLTSKRSKLKETTEQESFSAQQKTSRLVIVGRPKNVSFSVDDHKTQTPASFALGVGTHRLVAGGLSETFDVLDDKVTYLRIDSSTGRIYGFSMTEAQESEIEATATSREEVFEKGYKLYGKQSLRLKAKLGLVAVVALLVFFLWLCLRFSLVGRAKARVHRKRRLEKKLAKVPIADPKGEHDRLQSRHEKTCKSIKKFGEKLSARIEKLKLELDKLSNEEKTKKRRNRLQRKLKTTICAKDIVAKASTEKEE